jgi:MipA family protein
VLFIINTAKAENLIINLKNQPQSGSIVFALFDSPHKFSDLRDPVQKVITSVKTNNIYKITNIPPGEYALIVYHDENTNREIDRNFIGIPKEPIGFANLYRPKGPPSYANAAFIISENKTSNVNVKMQKVLGDFGQFSIGVGILAKSSPYRGYHGSVYQFIPAITYIGERVQWFGPVLQIGLLGSNKVRLAAVARYRMGVYEQDESDFLKDMGDRRDTLMAGLALQAELPWGIGSSLSYSYDILDRISDGEARLIFDKTYQYGIFRISPEIGLHWLGHTLSDYDFGVPADKATPERPYYSLNHSLNFQCGIGLFAEFTRHWSAVASANIEFLEHDIKNSPLTDKNYVINSFSAISYTF